MNHHVSPTAPRDRRARTFRHVTEATCHCGTTFTYFLNPGHPRTLCPVCTIERQVSEATRTKAAYRVKVAKLPKAWGTEVRRAYISAEGHLNKTLVQMLELDPRARQELLMRFMAVASEGQRARALPPRSTIDD